MKKKPLVCEEVVEQPWPTLTNVLLFDPVQYGGAIYDINPFGGWLLDPTPRIFGGPFYRIQVPLPGWPTPEAFDLALVQLLLKAAKAWPAGIIKAHPDNALSLLTAGISLQQIVLHPKTLAKLRPNQEVRVWPTERMKPNVIIGLDYPERVGRVCGPGLHSLGAFIFNPSAVAGVRLTP